MKKYLFFLCALLFFAAQAQSAVLINEFVYDAAGSDTGNEWIELYNTGPGVVNLQGWTLQVDNNQFPGTVKANLCGILPADQFYLIKETSQTISVSTVADFISGTLAMGNAGSKADGIQLLDPDGLLVDRVVYGSTDTDNLCADNCTRANAVSAGSSLSRLTPGGTFFVQVSSGNITPFGSGGLCLSGGCPNNSGRVLGVISEVAPSIVGGDYVEIFIDQACNPCGARLYEGETLIKTFPSVQAAARSFIVLHASAQGQDESSSSGDRDGDGVIDFYSDESSPGISGSVHNNITLKNSDGSYVDFVSWALSSETSYTQTKQRAYDGAVQNNIWQPACLATDAACYQTGSIAWSNRSTESMSRKMSASGLPRQSFPSYAQDWQVGAQSLGRGYSADIQPKDSILEIFQSPFSPYGDGRYAESIVMYKVAANAVVNIAIYDVQGYRVRQLLQNAVSRAEESQTVVWDGRNDDGATVNVGIYIVRLEAQTAGDQKIAYKTVVVARRL